MENLQKASKNRNWPLILGISIPVLMVFLIILSIYLPNFLRKPKYNFLFVLGPQNAYRSLSPVPGNNMVARTVNVFEVQNNKVVIIPKTYYYYIGDQVDQPNKLYVYNVQENRSKEISIDDAKNYTLDASTIAPDGFELKSGGYNDGFFPFFYGGNSDYNSKYLKKGVSSQKLNLPAYSGYAGSYYYYDNNFQFLGWAGN